MSTHKGIAQGFAEVISIYIKKKKTIMPPYCVGVISGHIKSELH